MKPKFMQIAKEISKHGEHRDHRIGAVIVKKNRVVSLSFNRMRSHPRATNPFRSIHAELGAIIKADHMDLDGATIYVYRQLKDGSPAISKPCQYCHAAIKEAGISEVIYSYNDYPYFVKETV